VLISKRTGLRAVAYGYIYPFLLIMIILISMTSLGMTELQAGLWSLISLVPYYLGIYLLRNKIGNSFTFKMEKIY
jgi:sigma-E factor negative regulatory protein RseC